MLEGSHCASCAHSSITAPDIRIYMRDTQSFSHLGGYRGRLFELSGPGDPAAVNGTRMSGEVFAALGVQPLLGRTFTRQEDEEPQQVAVLSYGIWRSRFRDDANVLGSKILLYRNPSSFGVGIRGITERVRELDGKLRIRNAMPGTIVEVILPLQREDSAQD